MRELRTVRTVIFARILTGVEPGWASVELRKKPDGMQDSDKGPDRLKMAVQSALRRLARMPHLVRRSFKAPGLKYAVY